jgi:AcrR family transcriptional regulator
MRERIVSESAKLFLARGFAAVSVDDIVVAAEIARSSFYRFFPNREEVLASTIRPVFEAGVDAMAAIAERAPRQIMDDIFGMYLTLWAASPDALRLATRMGGSYFRLFQDVHTRYRQALTELLGRVEGTGILLNDSGDYSARLIARTAVPVLEVYAGDAQIESLFRRTMSGLLIKPEAIT